MARNLHSYDYAFIIKNMEAKVEDAYKIAWQLSKELNALKKKRDDYLAMQELKKEKRLPKS